MVKKVLPAVGKGDPRKNLNLHESLEIIRNG
jgi:hypothetical protein